VIRPDPKPGPRKKVRRWKTPRCSYGKGRCKRPAVIDGMCASHRRLQFDRDWSAQIRAKGECELRERHQERFPCGGALQAAHGFSRRYAGTRHVPLNGFCICAASHRYWGMRPLEWDEILRAEWGETVYEELRRLALRGANAFANGSERVQLRTNGGVSL